MKPPADRILVHGNITSPIAQRINEAVDYDRFGRAHRFTGDPTHGGLRQIREIVDENYHSRVQYAPEESFVLRSSARDVIFPSDRYSWPTPIHHYVARALANDPMRVY